MRYELVSFDLDGTLVDTADEIAAAANAALAAHGIAPRPVAEIARLIGGGARHLMMQLLARCYLEDPALASRVRTEDVLASMDAHYERLIGSSAVLYPGCRETLAALRAGGVRLACVSNKEARLAQRVLAAVGLGAAFDLVVGGDTLAEKKPHASVLRHVARSLSVDTAQMAHVGDSAIDVAAARNAGVAAWAVPWGYDGTPVAASGPDRLFDALPQVAAHALGAPA